jgi:hypothetical protein
MTRSLAAFTILSALFIAAFLTQAEAVQKRADTINQEAMTWAN